MGPAALFFVHSFQPLNVSHLRFDCANAYDGSQCDAGVVNNEMRKSAVAWIPQNDGYRWIYNKLGGATWNHMAVDKTPADYIRAKDFDATYKIAMHQQYLFDLKMDNTLLMQPL